VIVTSITRPLRTALTVRLLVASTGTGTTELLGLAASVVGHEESAVVRDECLLQLVLAVLIDGLLVVGDLHVSGVSSPRLFHSKIVGGKMLFYLSLDLL
jgi:hypothetical protein